jgi:hypothetical protein
MKKLYLLSLALVATTATGAEQFNGSQPMVCEPSKGFDCLPTENNCTPLKPEKSRDLRVHIDVSKMELKSPNRTAPVPIASFGFNQKSLVMQGTASELVWSATIHRETGRLTLAMADREGAYVVFGQCKIEGAAGAPKKE